MSIHISRKNFGTVFETWSPEGFEIFNLQLLNLQFSIIIYYKIIKFSIIKQKGFHNNL